jgi:hypothetical protein
LVKLNLGLTAPERSILATLNRLAIELPSTAFANPPVKAPLAALAHEPLRPEGRRGRQGRANRGAVGRQGHLGDGVDGLLGMSFPSHFKDSIDTQAIRISSQKTK